MMTRSVINFLIALAILCISSTPVLSDNIKTVTHEDSNIVCSEGTVNDSRVVNQKSGKRNALKSNLKATRAKKISHPYQQPPASTSNSYKINVTAHAYCIHGFTSRGVTTRVGVVAVDPSVIPYGSKLYIPGYGWGTALDTGGSMRGNVIDIWMPTTSQCMQWGRKQVTITVVKP